MQEEQEEVQNSQDTSGDHDFIPDEWQEQTPLPKPEIPGEPEIKEKNIQEETAEPLKPEKRGWQPIDLSHGTIKKGIFGNRRSFEAHVRKDLKKGMGSMLTASQRQDLADTLANKRSHGLRPWEVKKELKKKVEEGKLSKFEAKKLKRLLKIKKSGSIF